MSEVVAPAPWRLTGDGYVFFYRFDRDFALQWTPEELQDRYRGGLGIVAFVDYKTSPVGAYRELLFTPGTFYDGKKARHSITRVLVSSYSSVMAGRANWGLPKERAAFDFHVNEDNSETLTATLINGDPLFEYRVREGLLRLPLPTNRFFPMRFVQWWEGQQYNTRFWGSGRVSLLEVEALSTNFEQFPDLRKQTFAGAVKITGFRMTFSAPKVTV